ncbi:hypothetical protein [Amnibacterium endophyticum]|uniref:WXG100 family type VII secretion target n=1 Tax=Amnibacterium endophyticum TaxID=2109337 RepID=A0ABW4LI07_9MICO
MDEVRFNEEQAAIANRIKGVDRQLDQLDDHMRQSAMWGLHGSGAGVGALARGRARAQDEAARANLQSQRDSLADQMRQSIERSHT